MINSRCIIDFCNRVTSTSSTTEKKRIVSEYKDDDVIKEFLKFLFDKQIVTGISTKKLTKELRDNIDCVCLTDIVDVMSYLTEHNTGTDSDVAAIQNYLDVRGDAEGILAKIITKSLKLGIDTKLVNTAIPGLIHVHEVQQALAIQNTTIKDGEWICLSQKLNGNRASYLGGKILSRQGKEFSNIKHIIQELDVLQKCFTEPMFFDGEIIRKNVDGVSDNENFRIGTGILNSDDEDKTILSFVIFDVLPLAEFYYGESKLTYKSRYNLMQAIAQGMLGCMQHVEVVPFLYAGNDHSMIEKCLAQMDAEGKEGCMLARDVPYYCKRHNGLLKVKTFYTMDLKVVDMQTGTGKNENTLGNLIVQYKDNLVGVGSGFSDDQRHEIWNNKEKYLGRIVEVKYKDITKDKGTGKESLQFPVFVRFREEGKQVSYN